MRICLIVQAACTEDVIDETDGRDHTCDRADLDSQSKKCYLANIEIRKPWCRSSKQTTIVPSRGPREA